MAKNKFIQKSVKKINNKSEKIDFFNLLKRNFKIFFVIFLVGVIFYYWSSIAYTVGEYTKKIAWTTVKILAKTKGKEAKKDSLGNVNILLLGIGGKNHDGGYLTDSMMVASFNPKLKTVTFLSIPRDLYVKYPWGGRGKLNYIFAREYLKTKSFDKAAASLEEKIKEITGLKINYYVVVDFSGFEKFIDKLGGIDINVPQTIVDTRYPGPNDRYVTFKITKGYHHIDGKTALKYARSRHSTSDFSRSARQEQIIKAIIKKLSDSGTLTSVSKLKSLYLQYQETVKTDLDFDTMLGFVPYVKGLKMHSYVINADCYMGNKTWKTLTPGCFVFPGRRDDFNGQAVLLPVGSNSYKIDNYKEIQKFVFIALGYPELWLEDAKIQILNGVNKKKIKRYYRGYLKPIASQLAYRLKNYGFNVVDVKNADKYYEKNRSYVYEKKTVTEDLLKTFVGPIDYLSGSSNYAGSGFSMTLILGEEYLRNKN